MDSGGLVTSEMPRHTNHGTQTRESERKYSVLLGQVGLIAESPDERAGAEHILGFPTRSVKFNDPIMTQLAILPPWQSNSRNSPTDVRFGSTNEMLYTRLVHFSPVVDAELQTPKKEIQQKRGIRQ